MAEPWKIFLSPPEVSDTERELLVAAFDSGWIAPYGPDLEGFEADLAEFTGATAVAALTSGTAALHLALMAVGVEPGDDVLVPDVTFAAAAFATVYVGARPCFVDAHPRTWQLDPDLLEEELRHRADHGRLPGAVVAVDLYGACADFDRIPRICAEYEVPLVEDAAEALGSTWNGTSAGRLGRVGTLSFNGNKIVTTGGGGALLSDDPKIVSRARHLSVQARASAPWYEHDDIGFNYRLGNLNAAVGRGQLATLPHRMAERRRVHEGYRRCLGGLAGVTFQELPAACSPNWWLTTVRFDPGGFGATAVEILDALRDEHIEARHAFTPMHRQPVFVDHPVIGGSVGDDLFATSVSLPSGGRITDEEVRWICDIITSTRR